MTARVHTFAPNGRSGCVTGAHLRFNPREKASPLTLSFHRTSFRRYMYRGRQKKHTICQPSRVAVAFGEVNPTPGLR
jgi:hypothetical protein